MLDAEERQRREKAGESQRAARQAVYVDQLRRRGLSEEVAAERAAARAAYYEKL